MIAGDVMVFKTTGEKVVAMQEIEFGKVGRWEVRRPSIDNEGNISHAIMEVWEHELETIEEHAQREIAELGIKLKAQKQLREMNGAVEATATEFTN